MWFLRMPSEHSYSVPPQKERNGSILLQSDSRDRLQAGPTLKLFCWEMYSMSCTCHTIIIVGTDVHIVQIGIEFSPPLVCWCHVKLFTAYTLWKPAQHALLLFPVHLLLLCFDRTARGRTRLPRSGLSTNHLLGQSYQGLLSHMPFTETHVCIFKHILYGD